MLILPGCALACLLRLFDRFDSWLDALSPSVAFAWGGVPVLWLLFFFLNVPLQAVSLVWQGVTLFGFVASAFVPLPRRLTARPSRPWLVAGMVLWIVMATGAVYPCGGRVDSDAHSYMTWLRNVDASWEENYPVYKNLYAPTHLLYAMTSFLARVDTSWVWTHAPAVWMPVMPVVQFSLARRVFRRKMVGYALLLLLPFVYAGRPLFTSLSDSHHICHFVLLPIAFWDFLPTVFDWSKVSWWTFPITELVAISLTFEHLPHMY